VVALAVLGLVGCGGASGVSAGATVTVYLSAPLQGPEGQRGRGECASAKSALARAGSRAGDVRVRAICLDASGPVGLWTLAAVGANARRAVEDSTTVAYLGEPDPRARRQSHPILEEAGIAEVSASSGSVAMERVLRAIEAASGNSLRESVFEALG
jgi:branched-chain amino acid transport system substrate-binding protein